jgi:hypothetical protein
MADNNKEKSEGFLKELAALCKKHFAAQPEKKFAKVKTKDGTEITYEGDMPMEGMPVFVIMPDGQQAPVPDGIVTLEDESQIEVLAGKIVAVKSKTPDAPATADMASKESVTAAEVKKIVESTIKEHYYAKADVDALVSGLNEKLTATEQAFAAAKTGNETLVQSLADMKASYEKLEERFKTHEQFASDVSKLLEEPQVPPNTPPKEFKKDEAGKEKLTREEWQKKYGVK